jgi:hypothetical protein
MFCILKFFIFIPFLANPSRGVLVKFEKKEIMAQSWIVSSIKNNIRYFLYLRDRERQKETERDIERQRETLRDREKY